MGRVSPRLHRPTHFACYAEKLETACGGGHRLVFAAPPQHGKSLLTLHGLAWIVQQFAGKRNAYITYSQERADSVCRTFRRILDAAGIKYGGSLKCVTFGEGDSAGQLLFTSIDGGITGEPVDGVAVVDDPFKNRKEADSAVRRQVVLDSYREAIETRVHPGASVIVMATRWHPLDLSGVLIDDGWEYINLPAIADNDNDPNGRAVGEPLFPAYWPLESLEKKREKVGEFTWAALYQGRPRPRGGSVFKGAWYYTELPTKRVRGSYGVDLAFSAKARSDWSICLKLLREERDGDDPIFYVLNVDREKVEAPQFADTLDRRYRQNPHYPMLWRASGTEKGSAQFIQARGIPLLVENPVGDKFVSATEAAAAWNAGRVLVPDPDAFPESQAWLDAFLDIVADFTGTGKEHDDDVDALGNAMAVLESDDSEMIRVQSGRR